MIGKEQMKQFIGKNIGVLYKDTNDLVWAKGILTDIGEYNISLETEFNILIISLESIQKIKISKTEL